MQSISTEKEATFCLEITWSSSADCLLSFRRLLAAPVIVSHVTLQTARVQQQPVPQCSLNFLERMPYKAVATTVLSSMSRTGCDQALQLASDDNSKFHAEDVDTAGTEDSRASAAQILKVNRHARCVAVLGPTC